jgi:pilus assembly protein CpaF
MSFDLILPFFRPIEQLLLSDTVSEIMVNPDSSVWIEENGQKVHLHRIRFEDGVLEAGLEVIANRFGKKLDADSPILNLRLPDGSRLAAIIPPVVNPRPLVTIRKFTSRKLTMENLVAQGFITEKSAELLDDAVQRGDNTLISGGTGTGKTTLANILANSIPDDERILTIEDTAELDIRKPHVVSAEAQLDTHKSTITFDDLLKAILRHRPDRIIIGEVRGSEARTLVDALNTGHRGMLATIHASTGEGALRRLANLALRGSAHQNEIQIETEIHSGINQVVHLSREGGRRHVQEILDCLSRKSSVYCIPSHVPGNRR